jgi:hypothetical protein
MPQDLGPKKMKLGDIHVRTRGDLTAAVWRDKRDVYMMTNIHNPPAEGNLSDEQENAIKPLIVVDYNRHMGYVDKGDRMANATPPAVARGSGPRNFFHLLDLAILNSYILLSSCGGNKISHRDFRLL